MNNHAEYCRKAAGVLTQHRVDNSIVICQTTFGPVSATSQIDEVLGLDFAALGHFTKFLLRAILSRFGKSLQPVSFSIHFFLQNEFS